MSYLDLPRLHFGGLFYTGPSTINNLTQNYTPSVSLEMPPPAPPDQYRPRVAGWNPTGVAQWWLEECTVLSAVGPDGSVISGGDAVIGVPVQSPSPTTPMPDGRGGFYDIAKMVDLDPDQQGRSAIYGLRISVALPGGAALQGLLTVPEIRQLNARIAGVQSSWGAVCNWMGTIEDVQWAGDLSGSPLLAALKAASAQGLAVKLTVDLHQNNPRKVFTAGDMFLYGRVLGTIGPAFVGELAQVVPGRCLQTFTPPPSPQPAPALFGADSDLPAGADADLAAPPVLQGRDRAGAQAKAIGERRAAASPLLSVASSVDALGAAAPAAAPPDPWNPAFAVIRQAAGGQSILSIDLGGCPLLNATPPYDPTASPPVVPSSSDGTFEVDSAVVGVVDLAGSGFVPFASGPVSFQYQPLQSDSKNCQLVVNSGVFAIPLTADEANLCKTNPLAVQVNGTTVCQENPSGVYADISAASQRLECGGAGGRAQIMLRVFGRPPDLSGPPPFNVNIQDFGVSVALYDWSSGRPALTPSQDLQIGIGPADSNGVAPLSTAVLVKSISPAPVRQPLDSQVYYVSVTDQQGNPIGDGPGGDATLSVLLWDAYQAPASPTWEKDVGPVFSAYARLYPGMKARLDISDEATVKGFAAGILNNHMSLPITDPAYMPVTRDLSPSKVAMINSWLARVAQQESAGDSPTGGEQ